MSEPMPIGVSLIARNEGANLHRCLSSVAPWVREIVMVVNDCTDQTVEIGRSFQARVVEKPWRGFREQKNASLALVTQPWVLCLDADEEVPHDLRLSLARFLRQDAATHAGACFPRKVFFLGRWITHGDWYPDLVTRFCRRGSGQWSGSTEHCYLEVQGKIRRLQGDLLHYSYPDMSAHIRKINYYADIFLERQLADRQRWSLGRVLFRPWWRFVRAYFIKMGFLDGFPGLYIATATAFATFVRHSRLYEYEHRREPFQEAQRTQRIQETKATQGAH